MTDSEICQQAEEILNRYIAQGADDPSEDRLAEIETLVAVTIISIHKGEDFQTILQGAFGAVYLMGKEDGLGEIDGMHDRRNDYD